MLHMVQVTHAADTCPLGNEDVFNRVRPEMVAVEAAVKEAGAELKGGWVNAPAHVFFLLVEAPNAHVVDRAIVETGLIRWNTSVTYAVSTLDEARERFMGE